MQCNRVLVYVVCASQPRTTDKLVELDVGEFGYRSFLAVSTLPNTLQAMKIETLVEFDRCLRNHRATAPTKGRTFTDAITQEGFKFVAVPGDALAAFLTMAEPKRLPPDFQWTSPWRPAIQKGVRKLLASRRGADDA